MLNRIEYAYSLAFMKFFESFDTKVIQYCQYALGYLPLKLLIDVRKLTYLSNSLRLRKEPIYVILLVNDKEFSDLCRKYGFVDCSLSANWKQLMCMYFSSIVNN